MRAFHSNENGLFCSYPLSAAPLFGERKETSRKLLFEWFFILNKTLPWGFPWIRHSNSKMLTNKHWECKKDCYERFHLDPSRVLLMISKWPTEALYSQKLRCPVGVTMASEMALAQGLLRYESLIKRCQLINYNLYLKNILHNQSFFVSDC